METISRSLLTFLLNALWQIPLAAGLAALVCRLLRNGPASHRHAVWVAALAAAILLPLASVRTGEPNTTPQFDSSLASLDLTVKSTPRLPAQAPSAPSNAPASRTISFAETTATLLVASYVLFVLFRLARLAWASLRTTAIHRTACRVPSPDLLERVWNRCQEAFGLTRVELLFSAQVSGPVTAGSTIILPESLLSEPSEDVLTTAIGHEMAHIARRDFACNLLYESLQLLVGFHPAAWLIQRGIERTREMACDELVTHRLINAGDYARSIISIAAGMTALPRPGYTLGVFDGDILEERIRRLVERPAANLKRARVLLVTGLSALAVCAVIASSLALTARAQGAAYGLLKQGEAAYNRGDFQEATRQFESAVQVEPANVKAKLLLADALLQQFKPGTDPDSPYATRPRQQYLAVLAIEHNNKPAIQGMMTLQTNAKQFTEAHEWAVKAIQVDATDKFAYYTAAFVDWAATYPDYTSARQAAGMRPEDPGIIPDAALRQTVRTQHMAQLEDGKSMLQTALQLDPEYSDAMAYMNLLYRIEAGIANTPAEYSDLIAKADDWVGQALAAIRKRAQSARTQPSSQQLNVDGPVRMVAPPPPPPPPPPPGSAEMLPQGQIRAEGNVQQAKLIRQQAPVYPAEAKQAGISGTVRMLITIARDGTVQNIKVVAGPPQLVAAAIGAVRQWAYQPTLLNGEPVEVLTPVNVTFAQ